MDFLHLQSGYYWVKIGPKGLRMEVTPSDRWNGQYTGEKANESHVALWVEGGWLFAGSEVVHSFDDLAQVQVSLIPPISP